tara:strand:+ start:1889 stop:2149 length:261 start_codon:yes stop_codon:yes gene_type:complete
MLIKKNDLVKRIRKAENSFYNKMEVGTCGLVIKGPYEKNISDVIYNLVPQPLSRVKYTEIKMVVDILCNQETYRFCAIEEYERVKN